MRPNSIWTLTFAALVLAVTGVSIEAAPPTTDDAPVCHWDFDGTLKDQAGRSTDSLAARDGTARFVDASELPGVSGKAVALGVQAGDAQFLIAPVSDDIHLSASYTIEAWIQSTQLGTWNRLVLEWAGPPNYAYHVAVHQGLASLYHNQANGEYLFAEGGRVVVGRWHHLAAVARRNDSEPAQSTLTVYLDGRPVGTAPYDGTIRTVAAEGLGIGDSAGAPSASCRFRGYIDEVTMWNRALAAEEIAAHYAKRADLLRELERVRWKLEMENRAEIFTRLQRHGVEEIVFAERAPGRDPAGHYYANFGYSCIDPTYWIHGADGGRLCKLNLRTGELTALVDDPEGAVRDPQVHYDGEKI
nr:LamG domain-containing protein [Planctomycetota bacterium]